MGQPLSDREQELVTDAMAVGVIDLLEPVEVSEQDDRVRARPAGPQRRVLQPLLEQ
jgi:hypothetical protein